MPASSPPPRRLRPTLADWVDLLAVLRRDETRPDAELRRRDRRIGADLAHLGRPEAKLVGWVRAVRRLEEAAAPEPGRATAEAVRLAAAGLALAGLALGISAAAGAFSFQPRGRINAVAVWATLVGVPGLFLLAALANALPERLRLRLPWVGAEPAGGGVLQPARWALRALPQRPRLALEQAWGRGRGLERLTAPVRRWLLLSSSQGAAVAFHVGALLAALGLVVFTDLAFGWSTTLDVEPPALHRLTDILSAPWAWAWPDARPSLALIEVTRFFRVAAPDPQVVPTVYGGWWPFLVTSLAVYGLLPRLVFYALSRARLRAALRRAMRRAPGAGQVLDRLQAPLVETASPEAADLLADAPGDGSRRASPPLRDARLPARVVLLVWADALPASDPEEVLGARPVARFEAGGRHSPEEDARAIAAAAELATQRGEAVAVAVRGFEPPLGEVLDALALLRSALGEGRDVLIVPVGGSPAHRAGWRRRLGALGDPWLALAEPASPEGVAAAAEVRRP